MSEAAALPAEIGAQIHAILERDRAADRIALVWPEPVDAPQDAAEIGGVNLRCRYCPSELAIREELARQRADGERLVIISPFGQAVLAADVLARLWRCEPQVISPWRTLQQLLKVNELDPRIRGRDQRWLQELLVANFDRYRGRLSFGTVLDRGSAWHALALALLEFDEAEPDLAAVLRWSQTPDATQRVAALPKPVMEHLEDWLGPRLGTLAPLVAALWANGHVHDLVGIGLACSLLYAPGGERDPALARARGQFDVRVLGERRFSDRTLLAFGQHCTDFVDQAFKAGDQAGLGASFVVAEQLLASLDLSKLAVGSNLLPMGWQQRLDAFASALVASLDGGDLGEVRHALRSMEVHRVGQQRPAPVERARLALRACAWLQDQSGPPTAAASLVREYAAIGGFVDWARSRLWEGDEHEALSGAYGRLGERLRAECERWNEAFAGHLGQIASGESITNSATYVEAALDDLIIPMLNTGQPILLLVMDGMSHGVYRELANSLMDQHWVELQRETTGEADVLLAALPSVTRVSRYALLAGESGEGDSAQEKRAFAAHGGLRKASPNRHLFHKGELLQPGSGGLAAEVRSAIADPGSKLVAVVVNAVDDQLSSNAQLSVRWDVDQVGVLRQLLNSAAEGERTVVLTSDHGHVLDHDMELRTSNSDNERCRPASESAGEGELLVRGARVGGADKAVILPWSERIRYKPRKMGYHGGGSLQEVVIPFGVFQRAGSAEPLDGWKEVPRQEPSWWAQIEIAPRVREASVIAFEAVPASDVHPRATQDLFAPPDPEPTPTGDWISALLDSEAYRQARSRSARGSVRDDQMRQLLECLDQYGGQTMLPVLAQAVGLPSVRLNGFLAGARKLLNVDGYEVLAVDRESRTVTLNRDLLQAQFQL